MLAWMVVLLPAVWLAEAEARQAEARGAEARGAEAADTIEVRGIGMSCPNPADVAQRLGPLLPAGARFETSDWIELREVPASRAGAVDVEVRLARAGLEAPLGVRRIARAGSCAEVADAIAVVVASWTAEFASPEATVPALPADQPGRAPPVAAPPRSTPARAGAAAATLVARPAPAPADARSFGVGALGGVVAAADGGLAPVVAVEGELRRGDVLARLQVGGTGAREVSLADGRAEWQRVLIGLSAGTDLWRTMRTFADVTLGPVIGVTWARGLNFPVQIQATGLDLGLAPAVRLGRTVPRFSTAVWIGLGAVLWLRSHVLTLEGATETRALPRVEGQVSVGLTFSFPG